jgi:hypothetical protein
MSAADAFKTAQADQPGLCRSGAWVAATLDIPHRLAAQMQGRAARKAAAIPALAVMRVNLPTTHRRSSTIYRGVIC